MQDPLHVSELLCARLCHDLSGALGSLMGATELAAEDGGHAEAAAVAAEAATMLGRRMRLLRAAWAGDSNSLDGAGVRDLAEGLGLGRRVELDLSGLAGAGVFPPPAARAVLNVLLLAAEGVAGNGRIAMASPATGAVVTTIEGPRAAWPAGLGSLLADETAAWNALTSARLLQAPLTALIARRCGMRLSLLMPLGSRPPSPPPLLLTPASGG